MSNEEFDPIEACKKAERNRWCVEGIPYEDACKMIEELNDINGISANIAVGGVNISCGQFESAMMRVCAKYGAVPQRGLTRQVQDALLLKKEKPGNGR